MRRLLALFAAVLALGYVLAVPASAESVATKIDLNYIVDQEGDCHATMHVLLRLEGSYDSLTFPLPATAKNISLNGSGVSTQKTESAVLVDISRLVRDYQGDLTLQFEYSLPNVVTFNPDLPEVVAGNKEALELRIPMLSGFSLPVETFSFVINMPQGTFVSRPDIRSTYGQSSFNSDVELLPITSNQIIGSAKVRLSDHEAVWMTMVVPQKMFPSISTDIRTGNPEIIPMLICAGAALVYWLLFLRTRPFLPVKTYTPPEGITAGELGCRLTLAGIDLTAMVFSWAQLGYLLISLDGNGRVLLHKRMEMGNERSAVENRLYRDLFGSRRVTDATGLAYARLCRKAAAIIPNERNLHKASSGSKNIYRALCCGSMIFCGRCVAMNLTAIPFLQILLTIILAIVGVVSGWFITGMAYRTHLRGKAPMLLGLGCMLLWVLLGLLCGQVLITSLCVVAMMLLGYPAAYGGRRSELGRQDAGQILGLRMHLKRLSQQDIPRLLSNDPDYFFHLAPCALALGVMNPFSKRFGQRKLPQCPYIVTQVSGRRTADEWGILITTIADMMDARQKKMFFQQYLTLPEPPPKAPAKKRPPKKRQDDREN